MFQAPAYVGILGAVSRKQQGWPGDGCHHCHNYGRCHLRLHYCYFANRQPAACERAELEVQIKPYRTYALLSIPEPGLLGTHGSFLGTLFTLKTKNTNMEMVGRICLFGVVLGDLVYARQVNTTE